MKKALAAILLTGAMAYGLGIPVGGAAQAPTEAACPADALGQARTIIHRSFALKRYKQHPALGFESEAAIRALRPCIDVQGLDILSKYWNAQEKRLGKYRRYRKVATFQCQGGPFGYYSVPCYIVSCESGYNPRARNPISSAGGFYQILDSTWYANGGKHYNDSHPAAAAPELEQHEVGARVYEDSGARAWSCA